MNLELIRTLSGNYGGGLKRLALDIGMTEANLHRCIRNNKIQAQDLEKIAKCLRVNLSVFFDTNTDIASKPEDPTIEQIMCELERLNQAVDDATSMLKVKGLLKHNRGMYSPDN